MVENIPIRTAGVKFKASFLILDVGNSYDMLLGRPWLREAGAVHDWGTDKLTIKWGNKKVTISTSVAEVPKASRPEEVYIAKSNDLWGKLEACNIVPVATLDLN